MKTPTSLPGIIIRMDDGQEFILDKTTGKYSLKSCQTWKAQGHYIHEYTYERLMGANDGKFKVADGTEDIAKMQRDWMDKMNCGPYRD